MFFYRVSPPTDPKPTILYCTPKPAEINSALTSVLLDSSEFKFLPRRLCKHHMSYGRLQCGQHKEMLRLLSDSSL